MAVFAFARAYARIVKKTHGQPKSWPRYGWQGCAPFPGLCGFHLKTADRMSGGAQGVFLKMPLRANLRSPLVKSK